MNDLMTRRQVLRRVAALGGLVAGAELLPLERLLGMVEAAEAAEAAAPSTVYMASGGTPASRVQAVLTAMGGIERFVRRGSRVLVKPNVGWARTPDVAANTDPEVVGEVVRLCRAAGARWVRAWEHSCDNYQYTFRNSGIEKAVREAGGEIYSAHLPLAYREVEIAEGKALRSVEVVRDALEADCLINVPVAKVHGASLLTVGIKNLMGLVWDRGYWHKHDLDQCIADFATRLKPTLVLVDASRILLTNGPQGPGKVEAPGVMFGSVDPVAADSSAAGLFRMRGADVPHLRLANRAGLGEVDPRRIKLLKA